VFLRNCTRCCDRFTGSSISQKGCPQSWSEPSIRRARVPKADEHDADGEAAPRLQGAPPRLAGRRQPDMSREGDDGRDLVDDRPFRLGPALGIHEHVQPRRDKDARHQRRAIVRDSFITPLYSAALAAATPR